MTKKQGTMKRPGLQPDGKTYISTSDEEYEVKPVTVTDVAMEWIDILSEFQKIVGRDKSDMVNHDVVNDIWNALIEQAFLNISNFSELVRKEFGVIAAYRVQSEICPIVGYCLVEKDDPEMENIVKHGMD